MPIQACFILSDALNRPDYVSSGLRKYMSVYENIKTSSTVGNWFNKHDKILEARYLLISN